MSVPLLTPGSGGAKPKPKPYDPLSSIQAPKPKPEPQKPVVPLVVYTAFDAQTAEELKRRLEETVHPVDQPSPALKKTTYDPPPYEHETAKRSKVPSQKHKTLDASEPPLADLLQDDDWEDEAPPLDLEFAWSSEAPFLSLDATEMSDYYPALENELVREVATCLRYEKLIHFFLDDPLECLKLFPTYTWDEESDAAAEKFIQWYVERFRPELERQLENDISPSAQSDIKYWIRNVMNDERESVIVYDLETGETLFVRYGDKDSVTMQELHQRLAEGRNIVAIHNHPNNSGASAADLDAANFLDAEYMLIVNPDGTVHRYQKIDGEIVKLKPLDYADFVAPVDPVETALHAIAYGIQTLREIGNPPEAVFEQGESLWWQEENIIVSYHTDETIEEVALRMIGPPPSRRGSGEQQDMYGAYSMELADFEAYLVDLNDGNTGLGMIYVPLPGWSIRRVSTLGGVQIQGRHDSGRTFLRSRIAHINQTTHIIRRWDALSPVEQRIEMALTVTDGKGYAGFDNIQSFDEAMSWIERNDDLIGQYAVNARVPKQLIQVILGAELLYDYDAKDSLQDITGRIGITTILSWRGAGVGNVHYVTLMDAYKHLEELNEAHLWHIDTDAPDLSTFPILEGFQLPEGMTQAEFDEEPDYEQEAIRFRQREKEYPSVDFGSVKYPIALYQSTDEGTINATSIVARMFMDQYLGLGKSLDSENLSAEDMARIWGRYRTSYEPLYSNVLGPNAQLALPLAEFFLDQD